MDFIIQFASSLIEWIVFSYFAVATLYLFIFACAGLFRKKKELEITQPPQRIAVLIPGYKEDAVILHTANDALKQDYPREFFEVFIIADSFQDETLDKLKNSPVHLIVVSFEKSTKSKALNRAMSQIDQSFDIAVVLDADNVMAPDFLSLINNACNENSPVVQGHRIAKNTNTHFAVLDGISEEINNHIFRKGHQNIGLSAALIGSGMAFRYDFFKQIMAEVTAVGGFDKELEIRLLKDRYTIVYLHDAIVYDEKVQKADVFASQRRRWLSAQFFYFSRYVFTAVKEALLKSNLDLFDKVFQMVLLPRVLHLGITSLLVGVYFFFELILAFDRLLSVSLMLWGGVWTVTVLTLAISTPGRFYNWKTLKAVGSIPKAFVIMFFSLFKLKGANKSFIHTSHGTIK